MKNIINHEAAPAVSSTGSTGSEAREGAPADLEFFLQAHTKAFIRRRRMSSCGFLETPGASYMRLLPRAYALVEDGCIHLGLVYPEVLPLVLPLFCQAAEVIVAYDGGAVGIHTPLMGTFPIITARDDETHWHVTEEPPEELKEARIYILAQGHLIEVGRQRAQCGIWA